MAETDHVSSDRQLILSAFQVQHVLQGHLFGKVMTMVDLKNESNMYFLQQDVRRPLPPLSTWAEKLAPRIAGPDLLLLGSYASIQFMVQPAVW